MTNHQMKPQANYRRLTFRLTARESARFLGISSKEFEQRLARGELPAPLAGTDPPAWSDVSLLRSKGA